MSQPKYLAVLSTLLLSTACLASTPGNLIRAAELKEKPFTDARAIASLPDNASVSVLANQGGWSQVNAEGKTGWVRLLNVRVVKEEGSGNAAQGLANLGGALRTGTTKSTATTGVKGLSKEDIAKAKPNPTELKRLDNFKASAGDVNKFASARKLTAQNVPELTP